MSISNTNLPYIYILLKIHLISVQKTLILFVWIDIVHNITIINNIIHEQVIHTTCKLANKYPSIIKKVSHYANIAFHYIRISKNYFCNKKYCYIIIYFHTLYVYKLNNKVQLDIRNKIAIKMYWVSASVEQLSHFIDMLKQNNNTSFNHLIQSRSTVLPLSHIKEQHQYGFMYIMLKVHKYKKLNPAIKINLSISHWMWGFFLKKPIVPEKYNFLMIRI